jgi:exodeoxyribonuclease V alpha subunit
MNRSSRSAADRGTVPEAVGFLFPFTEAGVFTEAEVHLAATVARLQPDTPDEVLLALAVAARGPRLGHICVVLEDVARTVLPESATRSTVGADPPELPWPDPARWRASLESAPAVVGSPADAGSLPLRPLVWDGERLYLQRYWNYELAVAASLLDRAGSVRAGPFAGATPDQVESVLDEHFGPRTQPDEQGSGRHGSGNEGSGHEGSVHEVPNLQRRAASVALNSALSVIAGGPGTGKTTTVAKLLLAAVDLAEAIGQPAPRISLAAPTGKAASRMTEAVIAALGDREPPCGPATTVHRLLGAVPGAGFRADAEDPIEADIVVLDETSMVDLSLMAHLLDAVRPDTTLVLVGDPNQLASVEAGTVLGDVVKAASEPTSPLCAVLTVLTRIHRFDSASAIAGLAEAIRLGDADGALEVIDDPPAGDTSAPDDRDDDGVAVPLPFDGETSETIDTVETIATVETVDRIDPSDTAAVDSVTSRLASAGREVVAAARAGRGAAAMSAASDLKLLAATRRGEMGLHSWTDRIESSVADAVEGDGTTLRRGERWYVGKPVLVTANDPVLDVANGDVGVVVADDEGEPTVALASGEGVRSVLPARLGSVEPWWAMTIHKSQGSEFPDVVVSLPDHESPILTRELLYTAVTRARRSVTLVASEHRIREAIDNPVARASGLVGRLGGT